MAESILAGIIERRCPGEEILFHQVVQNPYELSGGLARVAQMWELKGDFDNLASVSKQIVACEAPLKMSNGNLVWQADTYVPYARNGRKCAL